MSKRLEMLEKMITQRDDAFTRYALAMEYKSLGRVDDALEAFRTLRDQHADYLPQYLICGTYLVEQGKPDEGRAWLERGVELAQAQGNDHALGELREALGQL